MVFFAQNLPASAKRFLYFWQDLETEDLHRAQHQHHRERRKRFLFRRYVALAVLALGLLVTLVFLRHRIAYFYALYFDRFQHKVLRNSPDEDKRIEEIVTKYSDKTFGMDISHYQELKDIQWDSLAIGHRTIPISFVVMRASMGARSKDKNFPAFWQKAKKHKLIRGAYHYYRPDQDPVQQANNYLESIRLEEGDLVPVLDIEREPAKISMQQLNENLKIWLRIVESKYGKKPILYTYAHFYKDYMRGQFEDYPLWLANYNRVPQPSPTDDWVIWQFTEKGIVYGINTKVDLNVYNGSRWGMRELMVN